MYCIPVGHVYYGVRPLSAVCPLVGEESVLSRGFASANHSSVVYSMLIRADLGASSVLTSLLRNHKIGKLVKQKKTTSEFHGQDGSVLSDACVGNRDMVGRTSMWFEHSTVTIGVFDTTPTVPSTRFAEETS